MRTRLLVAFLAALPLLTCTRNRAPIKVAVQKEILDSGLVQKLAERFTRSGGPPIDLQSAAADAVFVRASQTEVLVTITDDAQKEKDFIRSGHSRLYTKFAYDDLLLLGPRGDRAKVRGAPSAVHAFQRIAKHKSRFCSPADFPLAHDRESALWKMSAIDPAGSPWYIACPGDALTALREASRRQAYTVSDRSSFEIVQKEVHLEPLREGDPMLHNDYAAILVAHQPRTSADRDAEWFVEWLSSYAARQVVENFRTADGRRFYPVEVPGR